MEKDLNKPSGSVKRETIISENTNTKKPTFSDLIERLQSINGAILISSIGQIALGSAVVVLSLLNFIEPLWLGTILTAIGSMNIVFGSYVLYCSMSKSGLFDNLIQCAVKYVVRNQN